MDKDRERCNAPSHRSVIYIRRNAEREKGDAKCLMHVAETFAETESGKIQRLGPAEDGRLAVHSLSAHNSRDRQAVTATAATILRPARLAHIQSVEA